MSILVIGANGGVGQHLVNQLKDSNESFTAGVRKEEQVKSLKDKGIEATLIDVEADDLATLTEKIKGYDKVIFSVGSGGSTGADKTISVDLDGAIKSIKASEANHVKQYVMVSTYDSRREAFDASGDLKPYTIAKHYADEYLKQANIPYTIVHPGGLTDEAGTNKIEVGAFFEGRGTIPREDVATVLKEVVTTDYLLNTEFQIISGEEEITSALTNFTK
ncbi:oxidoreductase [Staphylococcus succinus]|uniref:NAD(P)-dependent oxidoreductase n=1 Tax=Staphylococcus succinus TaxID=61015 RepID=A0ABX5IQE0_9STAP|nr:MULTISPECIES: NAD(P)-binding oxidoreductase [Staphylococcus]MBU0439296.1 SDR family oxidoreductase [Staphylococcus succinus]MDH9161594.1 SDR family oxidoreductase [Staphylococcus succinus]MEB7463422.1 SDR family oxidoreductase [Staphylococcus succinus]MEB8125559.1 SDR family oxidoreductase [Staphylococcus succinus]OIJ29139.1 oxidoreductase [Staphylococcus sp. LCT-H4]